MPREHLVSKGFLLIALGITLIVTNARASDTFTVLYDFDNNAFEPIGDLVFDSAGDIYGTAAWGDLESPNCSFGCGAVFKLSASAGVWSFEIIYSFTGGADGGEPHGRLTLDSEGNLYGTTYLGGTVEPNICPTGCGTVFELSPSGDGWTFTLLHSFTGADGSSPWTGLTPDSAGNLYGTTTGGGSRGGGTVFELSSVDGNWTFSTLYAVGAEGEFPFSDLAIDETGNIYGATQQGGSPKSSCSNYCGTVFELSPSGGTWKFSLLHAFMGSKYRDGGLPWGRLTLDTAGNVYGTTFEGGTTCDCGTVFKLSQSAGRWKKQILHRFTGLADGSNPLGGVIMDKAGNLYGTAYNGGTSCGDCGTVFSLTPNSKGSVWKFASLYSFTDGADGGQPYAGVIADASGNLYGATTVGRSLPCLCGTVFELSPP